MKLLGYLWALPNTLVGLIFALVAVVSGGRMRIVDGVLEIHGGAVSWFLKNCLLGHGFLAALTLGHVILGYNEQFLSMHRLHERTHVRQYEILGPFFMVVYLAASLWGLIRGRGAYQGNFLERKAWEGDKKTSLCVALIFCLSAFNVGGPIKVMAEEPSRSLSSAVFFGVPSVMEIKQSRDIRSRDCRWRYLRAVPAGSFLWRAQEPSGPADALKYRRRHLEEQIIVFMGEKNRSEARAFAQAVPLYLEWEGMSENPLSEAKFAGEWLQKHPQTAIEPFVHLFMAHRLRAGYECANAGREKDSRPSLAEKYRESLKKAESFHHPLISCVIQDMEAQPYVYLNGHGRP